MLDLQTIQEAVGRAVAAAHAPSRVILFGSYARGDADEGSDLDLMVIERHLDNKGQEMVNLNRGIGWIGKGVDVLVCSEEDFARRSVVPGTAPYWAATEGKVMYDAGCWIWPKPIEIRKVGVGETAEYVVP